MPRRIPPPGPPEAVFVKPMIPKSLEIVVVTAMIVFAIVLLIRLFLLIF